MVDLSFAFYPTNPPETPETTMCKGFEAGGLKALNPPPTHLIIYHSIDYWFRFPDSFLFILFVKRTAFSMSGNVIH